MTTTKERDMTVTFKRYADGDRVETADAFGLNAFGAPRWFSAYDLFLDGEKVGYVTRAEDGPWHTHLDAVVEGRTISATAATRAASVEKARRRAGI